MTSHLEAVEVESRAVIRRPAPRPCESCPYRRDVPSGVWHPDEYAKLPLYDRPTGEQPPGVFQCHQGNGRTCGGWAGCHDMNESMGLRLAAGMGLLPEEELAAIRAYVSPVPLWASGAEAAAHGLAELAAPGMEAAVMVTRLRRKAPVGPGESG